MLNPLQRFIQKAKDLKGDVSPATPPQPTPAPPKPLQTPRKAPAVDARAEHAKLLAQHGGKENLPYPPKPNPKAFSCEICKAKWSEEIGLGPCVFPFETKVTWSCRACFFTRLGAKQYMHLAVRPTPAAPRPPPSLPRNTDGPRLPPRVPLPPRGK